MPTQHNIALREIDRAILIARYNRRVTQEPYDGFHADTEIRITSLEASRSLLKGDGPKEPPNHVETSATPRTPPILLPETIHRKKQQNRIAEDP